MILQIRHTIDYRYERPVFVEPITVRMRPRSNCRQALLEFSLAADPAPAGRADIIDHHGNDATTLWFEGVRDRLRLEAVSAVQTVPHDPFDYLVTWQDTLTLPVEYPPECGQLLTCHRHRGEPSQPVDELAESVARRVDRQTVPFLLSLAQEVERLFRKITRTEGAPWSPAETLARGEGACRDLAVLFMDACRSQRLACRFVSGYKHDPDAQDAHQLHAWVEVYLPGAGWRGYDPSMGLATASSHVPVAAAHDPAGASPAAGSFRGTGVRSQMQCCLRVSDTT